MEEPAQFMSKGVPVSEERIERLVAEAEEGYDVPELRRRGGRRPLGAAPAEVVPVRLDPELKDALIRRAQVDHTSASEVIRQALRSWLHVA
ncbi:ribbon-helix-helix protein, CopG family [Microtetraspora sp. AC03309]|uniref:ribbon-helix-helix protein, CopG family n=1 Tax=Microtetraspora sp. AC03309 TaxID=2779376 RepID=UPI001E312259|nr:ribbon-helix-helix protein, CopG family [Microtetraspora sp. AC03309]MCC5579685.1 ribbon-helix-helix protein, CopG family [Microtetraspora sp. AC03309]